jgi:hypothetical protein
MIGLNGEDSYFTLKPVHGPGPFIDNGAAPSTL